MSTDAPDMCPIRDDGRIVFDASTKTEAASPLFKARESRPIEDLERFLSPRAVTSLSKRHPSA